MRKYIVILTIGILALGVCSCRRGKENPEEVKYNMREDVVFTASASGYLTKASDSALEDGDAIGIFALEPINAYNVKGTVTGSKVSTDYRVKWELNQTKPTRFAAYLPYNANLGATDYSFSVQADQSTYAAYQASDLRYAVVDTRPGNAVDLKFQHALSKLVVVMEVPDIEVQSVLAEDVVTGLKLNLVDGNVEPEALLKGQVTFGKAVEANGGTGYTAIMVPQNGSIGVKVTLKEGLVIDAKPETATSLEPGIAYKATVGLTGTFILSVTDWADDGEIPIK